MYRTATNPARHPISHPGTLPGAPASRSRSTSTLANAAAAVFRAETFGASSPAFLALRAFVRVIYPLQRALARKVRQISDRTLFLFLAAVFPASPSRRARRTPSKYVCRRDAPARQVAAATAPSRAALRRASFLGTRKTRVTHACRGLLGLTRHAENRTRFRRARRRRFPSPRVKNRSPPPPARLAGTRDARVAHLPVRQVLRRGLARSKPRRAGNQG